jgi:ribosomal protein S12 methylthiotransferase
VDNEVLINSDDCYLRVGDFCEVEITSASAFDLFAKPIKE